MNLDAILSSLKAGAANTHTAASSIMVIAAALLYAASATFDGDPNTNTNWMALLPFVPVAYALFVAKDAKNTGPNGGTPTNA